MFFSGIGCWSRSLGNPLDRFVICMGWMQAGCSDREELSVLQHQSCAILVTLWELIFTTYKNVLHMLYFVQTLCLHGEENANCLLGFFLPFMPYMLFHAHIRIYSLFGVKLWKVAFILFLSPYLYPDLFPLNLFADIEKSWGSCWHGRKWENHRKENLSQSCPRQPWTRSAVILRTLILPGTWSYLYKKSVYNLHPYMEGVF